MSGLWTTFDEFGQRLSEGSYHLDRQTGYWTFWYSTGAVASIGHFRKGEFTGVWEYHYEPGGVQQISEYDDEGKEKILASWSPDGSAEVTDGNGYYRLHGDQSGVVLMEGSVNSGEMVGSWISRFPDGSIKEELVYRDREMMMISAWDPAGNQMVTNGGGTYILYDSNGQRIYEAPYQSGRISGAVATYYPTGEIMNSSNFSEGIPNGKNVGYFISGQISVEGIMKDGKQHGEWTWWHEDGSRSSAVRFENGIKAGDQIFWEYGELIKVEKYKNGELAETVLM